jgi:hypothetical protein
MRKLLTLALCAPTLAFAQDVTLETFVRAESDHMIRANMNMMGVDIGAFTHLREPTTPDNQPVIRMNQDTLYSATVLDLSEPVEITLPEIGAAISRCTWSTRTTTCSWNPRLAPTG